MAVDPVPFFVGQAGVRHSAESVRLGLYASTNGAEGVAGVDDLKVQAQAVPNGTVRVLTGGALLLNRYAGGGNQSYALRNATATDVPVVATGSGGGRTDLVVARVLDTQYEGTAPTNPNAFEYSRLVIIQGVPAGIKTAKELNLGYPAIALAKITLPASTGTVTAAMITDLRRLANPRSLRVVGTFEPVLVGKIDTTGYKQLGAVQGIEVPEWATAVNIRSDFSGLALINGNTSGGLRVGFTGWANTQPTKFDENQSGSGTGLYGRSSYVVARQMDVPLAFRGTVRELVFSGSRDVGGGSGYLQVDTGSTLTYDIQFLEVAQ